MITAGELREALSGELTRAAANELAGRVRARVGAEALAKQSAQIVDELDEAATIDGAGKLRILFDVIVPNAKPALAAAAVFSFISHWNEFFQALIFLNSRENFTIPLGLVALRTYAGDPGEPKDQLLMAGSVIATLPIVVLFFAAQRYFVRGIVLSGIKG